MKAKHYLIVGLLLLLSACEFNPNPPPAIAPEPTKAAAPAPPAAQAPVPTPVPAAPTQAPAPVEPPATPPETLQTYTVRAGDNLYRIGLRYGVPWRRIAEANGIINPRLLPIGKVLTIPPPLR
jgi:2',3'-cyclic-nucleotide 2'-phosphodiesterase/3'-nucleotidase